MQCMKCGRDTEADQVFCESCREIMAKYPVKPGIVVQIPHRTEQSQKKQPVRRKVTLSPEEQIKRLRRTVAKLILLIVLLVGVVAALGGLAAQLYEEGEKKVLPGQNYFTATEATTEATVETTLPDDGIAG